MSTDISTDIWYRGVRMTGERRKVLIAMERYEEGLGPRAYRCLLQLMDGQHIRPADAEWLTDGKETPSIARMGQDGCELTAYGRSLADAAETGDVEAMFARTEDGHLMWTADGQSPL